MLVAEYDYDTDIAVQRQESLRIGLQRGIQRGIQQGFSDGSHQAKLETARLMLQRRYPVAEICLMTGLSPAEIEALK